jgi:cbb3-type cytochrome oxidase subunit 1
VLGLAFPIGALANTTNLALTIGPEWRDIGSRPVLLAAMAGSGLGSLAAVAAALAGFRSNGVLLAFTTFWDGVTHLLLLGALVLVFVAFAWHVVPNLVGRSLRSEARASRLVGRSAVAATVTAILLMLAGVITGYGWAGASFTGLAENSGADWQPMSIIPSALTGLALLAAIASVWYTVRLAFSVYSTLTTGRPTLQEVLVVEEEPPDDE